MKKELYSRVAVLSENQRKILTQRLHQLKGENPEAGSAQQLFAYVVLRPSVKSSDPSAIRTAIKERLPSYMVPTAVISLSALPRTANGKINIRALPAPQLNNISKLTQSDFPRTPIEESLSKVWQRVLSLDSIGIHDNFFDLGGDSILSIQIVSQARAAGFNIVPNQLFEQPTIAELAAVIDLTAKVVGIQNDMLSISKAIPKAIGQQQQADPLSGRLSGLVPIHPTGSRRPFFFHGGSADALTWTKFSWLLGADQPFYAMQRPDFNAQSVTHSTVEALATACIQDIRQIQPAGPYLVGGHCFGGTVAYEIARQLQSQGEEIASVIAVDAYCLSAAPHTFLSWLQTKLQLSYFALRKSYYYHGGRKRLSQLPNKIWQRLRRSNPNDILSAQPVSNESTSLIEKFVPKSDISYEERCDRAHQACVIASAHYQSKNQSQRYSGAIKLFRAEVQITDWLYGQDLGWQSVTPGKVEIENVPGLFGNLFNQRSGPLLAERVKSYLNSLQ